MNEQLIPNAVGRLDDVVEAIRGGNPLQAAKLLDDEYSRLMGRRDHIRKEMDKVETAINDVNWFTLKMRDREAWERVRVACGGTDEPVNEPDPWREAKATFESWRTWHERPIGPVVKYYDHLTAENERLAKRVAELEAADSEPKGGGE